MLYQTIQVSIKYDGNKINKLQYPASHLHFWVERKYNIKSIVQTLLLPRKQVLYMKKRCLEIVMKSIRTMMFKIENFVIFT